MKIFCLKYYLLQKKRQKDSYTDAGTYRNTYRWTDRLTDGYTDFVQQIDPKNVALFQDNSRQVVPFNLRKSALPLGASNKDYAM